MTCMKKIVVSFIVVFLLAAFATKINESKMQTFKWLEGSWEMKKKEWKFHYRIMASI